MKSVPGAGVVTLATKHRVYLSGYHTREVIFVIKAGGVLKAGLVLGIKQGSQSQSGAFEITLEITCATHNTVRTLQIALHCVVQGTMTRGKECTCSTHRRLVFWKTFNPLLAASIDVEPVTGEMTTFPFHRRGSRTQVKKLANWQPEIPAQTPECGLCFLCHLDI